MLIGALLTRDNFPIRIPVANGYLPVMDESYEKLKLIKEIL